MKAPFARFSRLRLTPSQGQLIATRVAEIEHRHAVQLATALVERADAYLELPWKAFALAVSMAGLVVVALDAWRPEWVTATTALVHVVAVLAAGAASALLALFVPGYARIFLHGWRRDLRVRRRAERMFFMRELFGTQERNAILILASAFERRVELVADKGVDARIPRREWQSVVACMTPRLAQDRAEAAFLEGLARLDAILQKAGIGPPEPGAPNEIPDRPIASRDSGA